MPMGISELRLRLEDGSSVSALLNRPEKPFAQLVLAHGAGAGMRHPFMAKLADGLACRGVATLRFQFSFMELGSKRPDGPEVAHAAVRAAVAVGSNLPLFAGGKSFGARMVSQAQAASAMPRVRGLVFFGYPLHPAKKPSIGRAEHLSDVGVPMLFLSGTRDALADMKLLTPVVSRLGEQATLVTLPAADHSFHVPARSGTTDDQVVDLMLDRTVEWMRHVLGSRDAS